MDILKNDYKVLFEKKDEIEKTISELMELLDSNKHVGMTEELVDSEGFPRSDIDVYSVRHARHQILCLQNDHKDIMKQIEDKLYEIHEHARKTQSVVPGNSPKDNRSPQRQPFLLVDKVAPDGPASEADIRVGDKIKQFGSVNYTNFMSLQDIVPIVQHSQNKVVKVVVERGGNDHNLELTPQTWSGRGLLGCNVVSLK